MTIFFDGTLQEGITEAIGHNKNVLCFVTDENEESQLWEKALTEHEPLRELLERNSVSLRLLAGSQEATYLSAFCTIETLPTIVIISNDGKVKEKLVSGTEEDTLLAKLHLVMAETEARRNTDVNVRVSDGPSPTPQESTSPPEATDETTISNLPQRSESSIANNSPPDGSSSSSVTRDFLSSRRPQLEARHAAQQAAKAASAKARGKARAEAVETPQTPKQREVSKRVQEVRKQKQAAEAERERILRQIENDKVERKHREAERKAANSATNGAANEMYSELPNAPQPAASPVTNARSNECRLQVRLLDGSTMRATFSSKDTIKDHVRGWIDADRTDDGAPYALKHLVPGQTSGVIMNESESSTLEALGLLPNASLVLVQRPSTKSSTPAVSIASIASPGGNMLSAAIAYIFGLVMAIVGTLQTLLPLGNPAPPESAPAEHTSGSNGRESSSSGRTTGAMSDQGPGARMRIRTLHDPQLQEQRPQKKDTGAQRLYNGNSLNFEPNDSNDEDSTG